LKAILFLFTNFFFLSLFAQNQSIQAKNDYQSIQSKINLYSEKKQPDSLNKYCDLYIYHSLENQDYATILDAYLRKVAIKRSQGDWITLIKTGQESIRKIDSLKIKATAYQKSLIVNEMIYGYIFLNDLENANFYSKNTITALKSENFNGKNDFQISVLYLTFARANGHLLYFNKAEQYLDSSLHFINKTDKILNKFLILNDVVSNNIELKNYPKALSIALNCLDYYEKNPNNFGFTEINMLLGRIYLGLKNYDKAIEFSQKPIGKLDNPRILYRSYETLYHANKAINRASEALYAYEKYIEYHERIFNERLANEKTALEKRNSEEKSAVLINKEKLEVENQIRIRNYGIIGAILFSLVSIGLFLNRKLLQKRKQEIQNQKATIEELNVNLEEKVKQRTAELQNALDEIKEAMQRGQSLERKRMAADLHDNLGSLLTAINISLDNINPENLTEREKRIYENVVSMTENAYSEIRILSHNLMPEELEKEGLENALKRMIQKINLNQKINFELIINELQNNSKTIDLNIYAICLEMMQNIIKHSKATKATISLFEKGNHLWLEVIDNGRGIDSTKEKGIGLKNIKNRLESLDGELYIDSEEGNGTKMVVSVPLNDIINFQLPYNSK
jgi:two-component system, NarL family, sensor histidine kinase FusK